MPRRPGETGGDGDESRAGQGGADAVPPPQLLGVHLHAGSRATAPLHPELKALLAFWMEKRGKRAQPARADMPVYELKRWEPHLAILEPAQGTFRFRLGGAALVPRYGRAMAGFALSDLPQDLRKPLLAVLDLAASRHAPVVAATLLRFNGRRMLWSELALPLGGGRAGPPTLLLASYPMMS